VLTGTLIDDLQRISFDDTRPARDRDIRIGLTGQGQGKENY
jgi:hypothetical protein